MFKSPDHKQGFENLCKDYELVTTISPALITRLAEKAVDTLLEQFYDEITDCFDEEFLAKAQVYMEAQGTDGDLDGFLDAVAHFTETQS